MGERDRWCQLSAPNQRDPETPAAPGMAATQLHIAPSTSSNTSTRDPGTTQAQLPACKGGVLRAAGEVGVGEWWGEAGERWGEAGERWGWGRRDRAPHKASFHSGHGPGREPLCPWAPVVFVCQGGWWPQPGPSPRGAPPGLWGGSDQDTGVMAEP